MIIYLTLIQDETKNYKTTNVNVNDDVKRSLVMHQKIYPMIIQLYTNLKNTNTFSGELFSFELLEYI
jgi:hypothetical protein